MTQPPNGRYVKSCRRCEYWSGISGMCVKHRWFSEIGYICDDYQSDGSEVKE